MVQIEGNPLEILAEAQFALGSVMRLQDGREFVYAKAGEALSKGKLATAPAHVADHSNIAVAAAVAVGGTTVTVTLGATAATANQYAGGLLVTSDAAGEGTSYEILSHAAVDASGVITLKLRNPIRVALTTSSEVTLVHNQFRGTLEGTVATRKAVGVPLVDVTDQYFYWAQYRGACPVLADGAIALGNAVVPSDAVSGAVEQQDVFVNATDATRLDAKEVVGRASILAAVDTEYRPLFLDIRN
jgi:hypothetical protein